MIKKDRHKLSKTALVGLFLGLLGVPLVAEATVYSTVYDNDGTSHIWFSDLS